MVGSVLCVIVFVCRQLVLPATYVPLICNPFPLNSSLCKHPQVQLFLRLKIRLYSRFILV